MKSLWPSGLRLSKDSLEKGFYNARAQESTELFIIKPAMPAAFEEALKVIYAGHIDGGSILRFMPRELVDEIAKSLFQFEYEKVSNELYNRKVILLK